MYKLIFSHFVLFKTTAHSVISGYKLRAVQVPGALVQQYCKSPSKREHWS